MAGIWTIKGIEKIKQALASNKPFTFDYAKLNLSDAPLGSIELHPALTELPNPYGSFVPSLSYDNESKTLYAEVIVPPNYGFPANAYVNGIGFYSGNDLVYVEQIVPKKVTNTGYYKWRVKINISNQDKAIDVSLLAFSYNAGESEEVTIGAGKSYTRTFAGIINDVKVYVKDSNGNYVEDNSKYSLAISSDRKSATITNKDSQNSIDVLIFYLISTNPIPQNITLDEIKKIASPIYSGSQPPAPTDGYDLFYYTESSDLYWANRDLNRWESITADLRDKVNLFWEKVVLMHTLDLSGRYGLYNYIADTISDLSGWDINKSSNIYFFRNAVYFENYKGAAILTTKTYKVDSQNLPVQYLDILVDALAKRKDLFKLYYDVGAGWQELGFQQKITLTNVSSITFRLVVDENTVMRLSPALYGFVVLSDIPLKIE